MTRRDREQLHLMVLAAVLAAAGLAACSPFATKGTMPPPAPNGQVDPKSAPDFISVADHDGSVVGYVRKELVLPADDTGGPGDEAWPVFGEDLYTVVGHMVPGKGFVPSGVDPATVPKIPVRVAAASGPPGEGSGQVVLYVRNDAAALASTAVQEAGQLAQGTGFWGSNMGVGCYSMSPGSRLVVLDRPAGETGASVVTAIYTRGPEVEPPSLWIVIGAGGVITQGVGVPAWWSSGPQVC